MSKNLMLKVQLAAIDKATAPIRAIMQSTEGLGKQLKQTRDQLRAFQEQQKNIQSFKALHKASRESEQALNAQQQKIKELSTRMREAGTPTKAMTKEFQAAAREAHRLKQSHSANQQQLQQMRSSLSAAGISTKNLGSAEQSLRQKIQQTNQSLTDQQNRLKRVGEQHKRLAAAKSQYEKTQQLAGSMATVGAGAMAAGSGVLYGGMKLLQSGIDFDAGMSNVQSLTKLDKNSPEMNALREQAKLLGAETMFTATQAAEGQGFLAMAGFTPEAILNSMPGVLDLSKAGKVDLSRTADIVSNVMSAMDMDSTEMGRIGDILASTFTSTNTSLESLGETMKFAAPIASSLGVSLETLSAMTGALGDAGIQSGMAGTGLSTIMVRIAKPTKEVIKGLEKIGISAKEAANQMKNPEMLLEQIYNKTKSLSDSERIAVLGAISGQEALKSMVTLVNKAGTRELHESIKARSEALGTSARASKAMSDNLAGDLEGLSSAFDGVKITIFEEQNEALRSLTASATEAMRAVNAWALENPELVSEIVKVVAVMAALVAAGGALMLTLAGLLGPVAMLRYGITVLGIKASALKAVFPAIAKSVAMLGKALLTTPLGLFVAASVVAALFLTKHWDRAKAFMQGVVSGFAEGFKGMAYVLIESFKPLAPVIKAVIGWLSKFMGWIKKLLAPVDSTQEKLKAASDAGRSFGKVFGALAALTAVVVAIKAVGSAVLFLGKALLANPIVAAVMAIAGLAYVIYRYWEPLKQFFAEVWSQVSAAFSSALQSINNLIASWSPIAWFNSAMAAVLSFFGVELPVTFTEYGAELIERFIGGVSAAWSGITEFFTNRWADIKSAFDGGLLGIATLILNWSPLGLFYQAFAAVFDWFGIELPGKFTEFGGMLMSGLINGIKGMAGSVKDAVVGVGESTVGWFKDKLGIRSPSRVFAEMGSDTAEGLAVGLAKNQSSPLKQVASLAKKVMAAGAITLGLGANVALAEATPIADQQQVIRQSISAVSAPVVSDQHQLIKQQVQAAEFPTLTQSIKQVVITAKQTLPDLTQRIIGVFSGQDAVLPTLQQKLTAQPAIKFDTREPLKSTANSGGSGGAVHISNTIHVHPTAGMDEAQLARLVGIEVAKLERLRDVRHRSKLGDLD